MNKLLVIFIIILISQVAYSQFRDDQDAKVTMAVISQFQRECAHKSGIDQSKISELQIAFEKVRADKTGTGEKALSCYQDRMSQLIGIHQLYKELCDQVSHIDGKTTEADKLKLLLMTQRYSKGVGPFHDLLNDCLIEKGGSKYLVKSQRQRTEDASLREELERIRVRSPFEANRVEFR